MFSKLKKNEQVIQQHYTAQLPTSLHYAPAIYKKKGGGLYSTAPHLFYNNFSHRF